MAAIVARRLLLASLGRFRFTRLAVMGVTRSRYRPDNSIRSTSPVRSISHFQRPATATLAASSTHSIAAPSTGGGRAVVFRALSSCFTALARGCSRSTIAAGATGLHQGYHRREIEHYQIGIQVVPLVFARPYVQKTGVAAVVIRIRNLVTIRIRRRGARPVLAHKQCTTKRISIPLDRRKKLALQRQNVDNVSFYIDWPASGFVRKGSLFC